MKPEELKTKREFMCMTQKEFGLKFDLSEKTIRNYETGQTPITKTMIMAVQALELDFK